VLAGSGARAGSAEAIDSSSVGRGGGQAAAGSARTALTQHWSWQTQRSHSPNTPAQDPEVVERTHDAASRAIRAGVKRASGDLNPWLRRLDELMALGVAGTWTERSIDALLLAVVDIVTSRPRDRETVARAASWFQTIVWPESRGSPLEQVDAHGVVVARRRPERSSRARRIVLTSVGPRRASTSASVL
jgi:hypothetical protein